MSTAIEMSVAREPRDNEDVSRAGHAAKSGTRAAKRLARIAGVLYLFVAIFGGFAEGYADPKLYVPDNAAATASTLLANAGLVQMAVVAHLVNGVFFVLTALALYGLLSAVRKNVAQAMLLFVAISAGVTTLSAVFEFEALRVATVGSAAGSSSLVLMLLDIQHYGTLAAQVFFGLWLAPLGYLAYRSGLFPKALGVVLVVATVSYLADVLAAFLFADVAKQIHPLLAIAPTVAEIWLLGYLLVKGVRTPSLTGRTARESSIPVPASA